MMQGLSRAFERLSPDEVAQLNTTAQKHILGTRLTVATAALCFVIIIWGMLDGSDRSERIALTVLEFWLWFLAAFLGINLGQFGIKRATDRDTKVAVATAKAQGAPPVVMAGSVGTVEASGTQPTTAERAAALPAARTPPTGDARVDDERGD